MTSIHLTAGGAYAKGMEAMRLSFFFKNPGNEDAAFCAAFIAATKHYAWADQHNVPTKSWASIILGIDFYMRAFPLATEKYKPFLHKDRPTVEFSFALPISVNHPETGQPLLYHGRMDQIVKDTEMLLSDDKTTSSLGQNFRDRWRLEGQFTGYVWGTHQFGLPVKGVLVRAMSFQKSGLQKESFIVYRSGWMIKEWLVSTIHTINEMIHYWKMNEFPSNLSTSCNAYGGCDFLNSCESENPEIWLPGNFVRRRWNPVLQKEEDVVGD